MIFINSKFVLSKSVMKSIFVHLHQAFLKIISMSLLFISFNILSSIDIFIFNCI